MIQLKADRNKIFTTAKNKLEDEDYDKLIPFVKEKIDKYDEINWYFEMRDFEGWTPVSAWDDAKFDFKNLGSFKKVAMVGAKDWEKWMTQLMKPFTGADVKFYELKDSEQARSWIKAE